MRAVWLILGGILLISVLGFVLTDTPTTPEARAFAPTSTMTIGGVPLRIAIADTNTLREHGLSGYEEMAPDEGMLFVFETDDMYSFWMKDMLFSIDMIWLDTEGKVIHIENNVSPDTFPRSFTPDSAARYVLETRAGFSDKYDIQIGSHATLDSK